MTEIPFAEAYPLLDGEDRILITPGAARRVLASCYGAEHWNDADHGQVIAAWGERDRPFFYVMEYLNEVMRRMSLADDPSQIGHPYVRIPGSLCTIALRIAIVATGTIIVGTAEECTVTSGDAEPEP